MHNLFSNTMKITDGIRINFNKNKNVVNEPLGECVTDVLAHFDAICDLKYSVYDNMESIH